MKITYKNIGNCWVCDSHSPDSNGYPVSTVGGKFDRVYRHFYRKYKGDIPSGMIIRHTCDNRMCINPEHLLIGTHQDNVQDRVERNRSAIGSKNGRAKLSELEAKIIKYDLTTPKMELGRMFKVDPKVIRDIQQGKTWKHI